VSKRSQRRAHLALMKTPPARHHTRADFPEAKRLENAQVAADRAVRVAEREERRRLLAEHIEQERLK
jgi:hypothetical protein